MLMLYFYQCHTNLTIQNYKKLHVSGLEVMHSDIDSVTTGQGLELQCFLKVKEDLS